MKAYSIRHKPTKTWLHDGCGAGYFLHEKPADFGYDKEDCESWIEELSEDNDDMIFTEDGEYPAYEFEVVEFNINEVK